MRAVIEKQVSFHPRPENSLENWLIGELVINLGSRKRPRRFDRQNKAAGIQKFNTANSPWYFLAALSYARAASVSS